MKVGVISRRPRYRSTKAILRAIKSHGHTPSYIHLGPKGLPVELDENAEDVAIRASRAVGLEVSGVDMILRGDDPFVLEVNASPGFRGLLPATGINAADPIVEYAIEKAGAGEAAVARGAVPATHG